MHRHRGPTWWCSGPEHLAMSPGCPVLRGSARSFPYGGHFRRGRVHSHYGLQLRFSSLRRQDLAGRRRLTTGLLWWLARAGLTPAGRSALRLGTPKLLATCLVVAPPEMVNRARADGPVRAGRFPATTGDGGAVKWWLGSIAPPRGSPRTLRYSVACEQAGTRSSPARGTSRPEHMS